MSNTDAQVIVHDETLTLTLGGLFDGNNVSSVYRAFACCFIEHFCFLCFPANIENKAISVPKNGITFKPRSICGSSFPGLTRVVSSYMGIMRRLSHVLFFIDRHLKKYIYYLIFFWCSFSRGVFGDRWLSRLYAQVGEFRHSATIYPNR